MTFYIKTRLKCNALNKNHERKILSSKEFQRIDETMQQKYLRVNIFFIFFVKVVREKVNYR